MDFWPLPRCVWSSQPSPWSPRPPSSTSSTWARSRGSRLSTSRSLKWQSASVTFIWCSLFKILRVASFPCCSSSMVISVYKSICIDRSIIQYRSFISLLFRTKSIWCLLFKLQLQCFCNIFPPCFSDNGSWSNQVRKKKVQKLLGESACWVWKAKY